MSSPISLSNLFKLRLVVGRFGEMDCNGWWNTNGVLGQRGEAVYRRGFPATHWFAQARVVFEVARSRCREVLPSLNYITLWNLPSDIEDQFDTAWHDWLDKGEEWGPFISGISGPLQDDLAQTLLSRNLVPEGSAKLLGGKPRDDSRVWQLPGVLALDDRALQMLAFGFTLGSKSSIAFPYLRLGNQ